MGFITNYVQTGLTILDTASKKVTKEGPESIIPDIPEDLGDLLGDMLNLAFPDVTKEKIVVYGGALVGIGGVVYGLSRGIARYSELYVENMEEFRNDVEN